MNVILSPRVAVVTGAAQGIGKAIALALADAGADIAVNDISISNVTPIIEEIKRKGRKAVVAVFDVADKEAVDEGTHKILEELGHIDILVNNAGITDNLSSTSKMTREKWDWEMSVNLSGAFNCTGAVLPGMVKSGWGRIIMISSLGALGIHRTGLLRGK